MLHVYLPPIPVPFQEYNDSWFDMYVGKVDFDSASVKKIMKSIDNAKYTGKFAYLSSMTDTIVDITNLSTGCKTAINVVTFTNDVFIADECGENVLNLLARIGVGNIYLPEFARISPFDGSVLITDRLGTRVHMSKDNMKPRDTINQYMFDYMETYYGIK